MARVVVRYYAGARAAAGVDSEPLEAGTVEGLVAELSARHGDRLARVLAASTLLVDGLAVRDRGRVLAEGSAVEVLPPFAGG